MKALESTWCGPWKSTHFQPDVECLDGGTGGFILLEPLQNADRIILIDAAADGNPIGHRHAHHAADSRATIRPRSPRTISA